MDMPVTPAGSSTDSPLAATRWRHGFAALGPDFHTRVPPTPLPDPYWVGISGMLARQLDLPTGWLQTDEALQALAGNRVLPGSQPLAGVYSGHQFGQWAGQLGDGRALLLGELTGRDGLVREVQLKGAGRTPYSRMGDGRAVLRSSIREFLCSEAMAGLGIPSTRALCVIGSDAPVQRETLETAAVVTRVAPSFLRFGHFEHFSARNQYAQLRRLADHVIEHHYPDCRAGAQADGNPYAALLRCVSERTARLLAHWQATGFCHGVMNTDNMSVLGLTLDFGPFQFMDAFDPGHVCNHSDGSGRYAFNRQPGVAYWNLACLAQALLPLIGQEQLARQALESYASEFMRALRQRFAAKLGLDALRDDDPDLIESVLQLLAAGHVDYTLFWRRLSHWVGGAQPQALHDLLAGQTGFEPWLRRYAGRLSLQDRDTAARTMLAVNPKFVLRNHLAEQAIAAAKARDFTVLERLQRVLETPFDEHPAFESLAGLPPPWASSIAISCSS